MEDNVIFALARVSIEGFLFAYLFICMLIAFLTEMIAKSKNLSGFKWRVGTLLGSIFLSPIFGLLILITCGFMGTAERKPAKPKTSVPVAGFLHANYARRNQTKGT